MARVFISCMLSLFGCNEYLSKKTRQLKLDISKWLAWKLLWKYNEQYEHEHSLLGVALVAGWRVIWTRVGHNQITRVVTNQLNGGRCGYTSYSIPMLWFNDSPLNAFLCLNCLNGLSLPLQSNEKDAKYDTYKLTTILQIRLARHNLNCLH